MCLSREIKSLVLLLTLHLASVHCYYNETRFKELVLHDTSNDDAQDMSTEELIKRSGFKYEEYYAVADDGYITQLLRVVNPKADRSKLKHPPILMIHGSHVDMSIYVFSSSIQHHPEPWPRKPSDGPITSSNRSLGFMLANNGFDVWLVGMRGSNKHNWAHTSKPKFFQAQQPHFKPNKSMLAYSFTPNYWYYGLDDVIQFELRNQIDLVRNITGFREFNCVCFSISTLTTMAFFGENPDYARDVRAYVQMAPVIKANHFSNFGKFYWETLVPILPTRGIGFTPTYLGDDVLIKNIIFLLSKFPRLRYSLIYQGGRALFGPSPIYQSNYEMNVIKHILQPVSFKAAQHYGMISKAGKFIKFDYGSMKNLFRYNSTKPPVHKIDKLDVQNYIIVSGDLDVLADPITVQRLKETTRTKRPIQHIAAPGFNHMDILIGTENDLYVNLPLMRVLDELATKGPVQLLSRPMKNSLIPGRLTESPQEAREKDRAQIKTALGF